VSGHSQSLGSLEVALSHAARLLPAQPALAAEQAAEILKVVPDHPVAMLLLAVAHRSCGDPGAALEGLQQLCLNQPRWAEAHYELGTALESVGRGDAAIVALRRAVALKPDMAAAWRLLADHLDASGDTQGADEARARFIKSANRDPRLMAAAAALVENKLPQAEALLRAHLKQHETDVAALRMLAEVAARLRRYLDAQALLERCLELAPGFDAARHNYATVLFRQAKAAQALPHVQQLLAKEPRNPGYRNLKAAILAHLGDYAESIEIFQSVLAQYPQQPKIWLSYGHALKTAGRFDDSVAAYRCAIDLEPTLGEAYWSLANLKTFRFADADVGTIGRALARSDLSDDDRLHLEYAFGKALEDAASYQQSFAHYSAGAAIRRKRHGYSAAESEAHVRRSKALFVPEFLRARAGAGAGATDPIFILGMPRAGSTLIEQILASHSLVEGTMELPDIPAIVRDLAGRHVNGVILIRELNRRGAHVDDGADCAPGELRRHGDQRDPLGGVGAIIDEHRRADVRLAAADFLDAQIPVAGHRSHHRQPVERDAVEAAAIDLPGKDRLLADGFRLAAHDAAAREDLCGARFDVLSADRGNRATAGQKR